MVYERPLTDPRIAGGSKFWNAERALFLTHEHDGSFLIREVGHEPVRWQNHIHARLVCMRELGVHFDGASCANPVTVARSRQRAR